ncbi:MULTISPECIES: hypothetical protein [unclassified Arsukibacterium]|nr:MULTISPECIES: hypothetical protein [unclassified Arsukibacterium]
MAAQLFAASNQPDFPAILTTLDTTDARYSPVSPITASCQAGIELIAV